MKGKDTVLMSCQEDGSWDFEYPLTLTANGKYDHAFPSKILPQGHLLSNLDKIQGPSSITLF